MGLNKNKISLFLTAALFLSFSACSTNTASSQTTATELTSATITSETTEITTEDTTEETTTAEETEETVPETTTEETTTSETKTEKSTTSATSSTTKPAAESKDTKEFQAFFMSTFTKLTGNKPAKFKAKNPQPCTVYVIAAGDGFEVDNKLVKFEDTTEDYFSKIYKKSMSSLEEMLENKGKTLYYTSDPNRASVIIVCNRKYVKSKRQYVGVTAYDSDFSETFINTKTHKQKKFKCYTQPGMVIRVKSYGPYYCDTLYDTKDYDAFLDKVKGWFK